MSYFPEPYCHNKNKINVELDSSRYSSVSNLKSATSMDTSKFAKMANLASLKPNIDEIDIDKLEDSLIDLSKLSNVIKDEVKKTE